MHITILHPGTMGAALGARLHTAGHTVLWHPPGRSDNTARRASHAAMTPIADFDHLMTRTDLVISICPATAATHIADMVAESGFQGLYVEANAVGPTRMHDISQRLTAAAITVIDAAIAGPPPTEIDTATVIYLAGPTTATATIDELFTAAGLSTRPLGQPAPAASALKSALISVQRTLRLLAALAHGIADAHAITDHLVTEAHRLGLGALADRDGLSGVAARAWRWQAEMTELSTELRRLGLPADLAESSAVLFERLADAKDQWNIAPEDVIERLTRTPSAAADIDGATRSLRDAAFSPLSDGCG